MEQKKEVNRAYLLPTMPKTLVTHTVLPVSSTSTSAAAAATVTGTGVVASTVASTVTSSGTAVGIVGVAAPPPPLPTATPNKRATAKTPARQRSTPTTPKTPNKNLPIELQQDQKRRSSSRSIKRKRFDDEIVEYSIVPQNRNNSDPHRVGRPRTTSQTHHQALVQAHHAAAPQAPQQGHQVITHPPAHQVHQVHQVVHHQGTQTNNQLPATVATVTNVLPTLANSMKTSTPTATVTTNELKTKVVSPEVVKKLLPVAMPAIVSNVATSVTTTMPQIHASTAAPGTPKAASPRGAIQKVAPPKVTPVKGTSPKMTAVKATPPKIVPPKPTPAKVVAPKVTPAKSVAPNPPAAALATQSANFSTDRRRPGRTGRRTRRAGRNTNHLATKDLGRWKPNDDLALIFAVQQTNDLRLIQRTVKFSCRFTFQELQARWNSLMFEPTISRLAVAGIRNLHPEMVEAVQNKALFSVQEEELLSQIKSTDNPKLEQFQELLDNNAMVFFSSRTAKSLQNHWCEMKQYELLCDQVIKPQYVDGKPVTFSDAEDLILDGELSETRDEALEIELRLQDRAQKRQIRILETELSRWNVLIDSISNANVAPDFDSQTLAILRGKAVRYLMRSKEITFGRTTKDLVVDVDLALEGPSAKISRRQGTIKLRSNGDFFISNEGKRAIFINGNPLLNGNKTRLFHNAVLEISGLRFVFLVNYELITAIRHESAKTTAPLN